MIRNTVILILIVLVACEDPVNVTLPEAPRAIVVDAWVNNKMDTQIIKLSYTQPYFDSAEPVGITGAIVTIADSDGNMISFTEGDNGNYTWDPLTSTEQFEIGKDYTLNINADGNQMVAFSSMKRVPVIDSIKFTFKEERNAFQPEGFYGEFVATDFEGPGDSYWIRSYKNGVLLNRPFELNIAFDAGFNEGGNIDGLVFIQPIQDAVNPLDDELTQFVPYEPGDSLYVEIHSVTNESFYFLQQVQIQTQRDGGFDEIFAEPLENVDTNIQVLSGNTKVIGWFNMAAVQGRGRKLNP